MQFLTSHKISVSLLQVLVFCCLGFFFPKDISHISFLFSCIQLMVEKSWSVYFLTSATCGI